MSSYKGFIFLGCHVHIKVNALTLFSEKNLVHRVFASFIYRLFAVEVKCEDAF
jgi:hypothetical protein